MNIEEQLQQTYDKQYNSGIEEWRMLGATDKAKNIVALSEGIPKAKVLDVGAGEGSVLHFLDKHQLSSDITAVEISQSGIEKIKDRKLKSVRDVVLFDGYRLPFEDKSFDLVTCSHVLEHVEHPRLLLREIKRVSSHQIFEVPIDFSYHVDKKVSHFLSYGHINIFTPQTFRFLLLSEGLEVIDYKNSLYSAAVYAHMTRTKPWTFKLKMQLKRALWHAIPFLMNRKPNATTVKCKSTDGQLNIM